MKEVIKHIEEMCEKFNSELVIVSKNHSIQEIEQYYELGYRNFAENKVQELLEKIDIHNDINWHFIGRLQTNKVKEVVKNCSLLHSLNRYELIDAIQKEAKKQNKVMPCLIQFNIAKEETKSGFEVEEWKDIINYLSTCPNILIKGIMCMGPHIEDEKEIHRVFQSAKSLYEELKKQENTQFQMQYLSMGMSNDYEIALQEGSNMIRVGRILF